MDDLRIRDLTIEYSSGGYAVRPIERLDLDISSGELVLLLGASGCGKTTLLSALAAILRPTAGSIRFGPTEVTTLEGKALTTYRRERVGIVFQAFNLIPSLTASQNVEAAMWAAEIPGVAARARASALLAQVDLTDRAVHRPGDLSGGQQQRVAIARALANDPPLILADEPTAHLDYIQVEGVIRLLRDLAAPGRMVVIATHDERLLPLADRVIDLSPRAAAIEPERETRTLAAGEVLFRQGEPGDLVWVVDHGVIELVRERVDGSEEHIAMIDHGEYFGELAPVFGLRRSATARAASETRLTGYGPTAFRQHMRTDAPGAASALRSP